MAVRDWVLGLSNKAIPVNLSALRSKAVAEPSARVLGDLARDKRDWPNAVKAYLSYLKDAPSDAAIWVQLGHAEKENGDYEAAEKAYRSALALTPTDADLLLQLGHLMKLKGRQRDAIRFYEGAVKLDAASPAYRELIALGQAERADALLSVTDTVGAKARVLYQIDDIIIYMSSHKTVSGIQRVQLEVIRDVIERETGTGPRSAFVFTEVQTTRIWEAPTNLLQELIEYLDEPSTEHEEVRRIVTAIRQAAVPVKPRAGDTFVMLGAFWAAVNNTNVITSLKETGVTIGVYFHDIIPVTHPELCDLVLVNYFTQFLAEALCVLDFGLANSEFTAAELRRFIESEKFPNIPILAVPLAHSMSRADGVAEKESYFPAWNEDTAVLQERAFVLCVSTIEARKNHKYLFEVWRLLIANGVEVPDLVFVGRYGWRVNEFIDQLKATRYLDGRIHIMHDLSDRELETLYRECAFTAFTSIVEGWGLPVGESLAYGKVCVASNTASMPEVGGDLAVYIDPLNVRHGYEVFGRLLTTPSLLATHEDAIKARFVPRSWPDFAVALQDAVRRQSELAAGRIERRFVPVVEPLEQILISDYSPTADPSSPRLPRHPRLRAKRLLLGRSWHYPEIFGAWMEGTQGSFRFATPLGPRQRILLILELTCTTVSRDNSLVIDGSVDGPISVSLQGGQPFTERLVCETDVRGEVVITLTVLGTIIQIATDKRRICVGLVGLSYAAEDDVAGRAELLERELFDRAIKKLEVATPVFSD